MREINRVNEYAEGAEIRRVSNGFVVRPPRNIVRGDYMQVDCMYVFRTAGEMAEWFITLYSEKP